MVFWVTFLFSVLSVSPYVMLLSLSTIPCTVLYRVSTHRRTILDFGPDPNPVPLVANPIETKRFTFFSDHEMDNHRLKTWLQLHLATDASTVINLPFVLNGLAEEDFLSQGHVQKWTIRISSLMHSKDPGARWAGLSIALRTATLSRDVMNECAHGWITTSLPMLFVSAQMPLCSSRRSRPP